MSQSPERVNDMTETMETDIIGKVGPRQGRVVVGPHVLLPYNLLDAYDDVIEHGMRCESCNEYIPCINTHGGEAVNLHAYPAWTDCVEAY